MDLIKFIANKMGMDGAIAYSSVARIVQGVAGVVSVFFLSTFLSGVEQGYYFTFGSILAMQVFFELGLTGIMAQYVAHEASHLELNCHKEYTGESSYRSRLASLLHFCVKWYLILAIIVLLFLIVVGIIYFNKYGFAKDELVDWQFPWILVCIVTAIQLFISPITSILSGLGFVKDTSKILFYQQIFVPLILWLGLYLGLGLFVLGMAQLISVIVWLITICRAGLFNILINLWEVPIKERVDYFKEIFPYQWKIAFSWVSGFFIFQLFNPVLFATEGPVVAGQMGMTLTVLNAISAFSMSWLNTKIPVYSKLIALSQYEELDSLFDKTLKQMSLICVLLLVVFFSFLEVLRVFEISFGEGLLADRFLSSIPLVLMIIPILINQYNNSWATYLRCHKEEPLLVYSIVAGIACMLSTLIFGHFYGLYGVTVGYFVIRLVMMPWIYSIYKRKKIEWHG